MKEVFRKLMQIVSLVILIGSPMFLYSAYKINQSYKSLQNYKLKECKIKDVDYDYTDSGVSGGSFIVQAKYNDYFVYWEDRIEENFIVDSFNSNRKVKVWIHENFKRALYIGIDGKKDLAYSPLVRICDAGLKEHLRCSKPTMQAV